LADAHKNAAYSLVATAPSPATSGLSLVVTAGEGARFPAPPFNVTVWATGAQPSFVAGGSTGGNFEIIRVGAVSTDTLSSLTRAQEGTTARTVVVGDQIAATITAKTLTDVEATAAAAYTPGGTDVAVADGGTGASTAATARTNLGLPDIPWTLVTKAADESVASSTVVQNDDELFFTAASGGLYDIEIALVFGSPAGAGTPDIKMVFGEDATARGAMHFIGARSTADATVTPNGVLMDQTVTISLGAEALDRMVRFIGTYRGGGGTFRLLWAQNVSGVNATIVRAGSVLRYRRIV
jgi:hypothetical protein